MATDTKGDGAADDPPMTVTGFHAASPTASPGSGDPVRHGRSMADIAERSQRIVADWLKRQQAASVPSTGSPGAGSPGVSPIDPLNIGAAFMAMTARLMAAPAGLMQAQIGFWQDYMTLWHNTTRRFMGIDNQPVIQADPKDQRFTDDAWNESEVFDFIKQSYLLSARYVHDVVGKAEGLDRKAAQKVDFFSRQFVDAMSPSNFLFTNPQVLRKTVQTKGENLLRGLNNLLGDLERGQGRLSIKMTGRDAFALGRDIAVSPGKVVFQNELMQLIQYAPTTPTVLRRPLLIVPPWINKFYIFDLRPKNSLVRWAVAQGHTVFMLSWVNPDHELAEKGFDDYMRDGALAALDVIAAATGEREVNAAGYCLGGTLLAATLAWMQQRGDQRIRAATFLATMLDFSEAGELGVFIDEEHLAALEQRTQEHGAMAAAEMAQTFNMLRSNDLIWSFVVNNYLMGNEPLQLDLLYWNSDSTRMPARMHSFYLRNMYQANRLVEPGGITLDGVAIDLSRIDIPTCFVSTREDHISPWKSTYRGAQALGSQALGNQVLGSQVPGSRARFVLATSGHIAGVVNPPGDGKYSHWVNEALPATPEAWLDGAVEMAGSWWPGWHRWMATLDDAHVPARQPGHDLPAIEDAPGSYVRVMS